MNKEITLKCEVLFKCRRDLTMLCLLLWVVFVLSLTTKAQTSPSPEAKHHFQTGIKLQKKFSYDEAVREFEEALKLSPDFAEAHHALGLVYIEKQLNEKAIKEFNEVLRLNPNPRMVREAQWAIKRLEKPESEQSKRRKLSAPNVKKLVAGWDKIIPAVRNLCKSLQSILDDDFDSAEEQLKETNRLLNSNRYYPKWYVIQFEKLLSSPNASQRLAALIAVGDLISEIECSEEWNFLGRKTLGSKLRSLARNEKSSDVRNEAVRTLEQWEEADWWWNKP